MTTKPRSEPDLALLATLPVRDATDEVSDRILRLSRGALEREHIAGRPAWVSPMVHAFSQFVVPAMLASAAAVYLFWAFSITLYP